MTYEAITTKVEGGKIILPPDVDWPNGTMVRVEPMAKPKPKPKPSVWDVLDKYDGIANDLPEDLAENLDHYVHGHPKK